MIFSLFANLEKSDLRSLAAEAAQLLGAGAAAGGAVCGAAGVRALVGHGGRLLSVLVFVGSMCSGGAV